MKVLVFNFGSSSIKYQMLQMRDRSVVASGLLERIGESQSRLCHRGRGANGGATEILEDKPIADHARAMDRVTAALRQTQAYRLPEELFGIGHRLAHGGEAFREPALIDDHVLQTIRELAPLAPLHNPIMVAGIELALAGFADVPHVAVFDTAYHHTIPPYAYHYAVPRSWYEDYQVRKYGFHGTSIQNVAKRAAVHLGRDLRSINLIVLHLGNGASAAAIRAGQSVDTSMGMTPLDGLMMGTRCGELDPAVAFHMARATGWPNERLEAMLNRESGLKGVCGVNDLRQIQERAEAGDPAARLALDMYVYRIRKYIGAYFAVLGHVDAVVFTAGIGENSALVRARSCDGLHRLGIAIDPQRNQSRAQGPFEIQADRSQVKVLVIPTNEELEIAEQVVQCIRRRSAREN